jgi:hypothetical protein
MWTLGWVSIISDDYPQALANGIRCADLALTPFDRVVGLSVQAIALIFLRRLQEGQEILARCRQQLIDCDYRYLLIGIDLVWGVALALQGRIAEGTRHIKKRISCLESSGYVTAADWYRLGLCDIYLELLSPTKKPSLRTIAKNFLILLYVRYIDALRIPALMARVGQNPHFDQNGHFMAGQAMRLGLYWQVKKKPALAIEHLTKAQRIEAQFGKTPMLGRVETALAELTND